MKLVQPKSYSFTLILMILVIALTACNAAAAPAAPTVALQEQVKLVISGSGGTASILKPLAEQFRQEHSNWSFEFLSGAGTGGGVKGALDGTLDLGTMARAPKDEELAKGIKYLHFATDRIVFATSQDISVSKLTTEQLTEIFSGKITNWSKVGGPDAPINLLVRDEEESNTQVLRAALFGETPFPAGAAVFTSEGDLRKALGSASQAIAYISYSGLKIENVSANTIAVGGMAPADLSNDYPYSKPAGLAYLPANEAKLKPFLDFITSKTAETWLAEKGIVAPGQ